MFEYLNRNDLWRFNSSNGRTKAGSVAKPQLNVVSIRRLQNKQTNKQTNQPGRIWKGEKKNDNGNEWRIEAVEERERKNAGTVELICLILAVCHLPQSAGTWS